MVEMSIQKSLYEPTFSAMTFLKDKSKAFLYLINLEPLMHYPFEIIKGSNYMNAADYTYTMTIDILYQSFKGLYNVAISQNSSYLNAVVLNNDLVEQSKIFMDYLSKLTF